MAFELTNAVWASRRLTSPEKLIMLRIADRFNVKHGCAWPSIVSLAADCSMTKQGVTKIVNRLIASGYLIVRSEHTGTTSRRYALDVGQLMPSGNPGLPLDSGVRDERGANGVTVEVNPEHPSGKPRCPESGEAPEEPQEDNRRSAPALAPVDVPFKVHVAIAKRALEESLREDRSEDFANVCEIFKRFCAQQQVHYDSLITRKAVEAAFAARANAWQTVQQAHQAIAAAPPLRAGRARRA